ncbi:MAG TPA: nitronate monooxygenase [Candidatus Atribacteria bacterium]|nr:nitronate monooxygenase [Candidatus Atribacteria bacterium]
MNFQKISPLRIGNLEAKIPIIQGGMAVGISLSGLASAVANEGGIGVIGTAGIGMLEPDAVKNFTEANKRALRKVIRKAQKMTRGIIGVNIMVALSDFYDMVKITIEEKVDLIFIGAGLPLRGLEMLVPDKLKKIKTKIVPIVSSSRAAKIIFQYWKKNYKYVPDAVVVEGPLAGGHLGFRKEQIINQDFTLDRILPEVISVIQPYENEFSKHIPIIAAGGIYTGADIYRYIQLGAKGVQMATRFVATYECDASIKFKEAYLKCQKDDLMIIDSPVGLPGRAIKNKFLEEVSSGIRKPFKCPWKCLTTCNFKNSPYCIALALFNAQQGKLDEGFAFAGSNAYRADKIVYVKELMANLLEEYEKASSNDH